jgi:hypothetical protein
MATNIIFYNSALPDSVLIMSEYYYKNYKAGTTLTVKDVYGVNTATLTTYCSNLTAIYTEIMIACACESTASSTPDATLNLVNQAVLYGKLVTASVGTLTAESAVADTHTTTTIGNTAAYSAINAVVGTPDTPIYVLTTAGTGSGQLSTIKSNTVDAVTIYGTFYAEVDNDTKHKIVTGSKLFIVGKAQAQTSIITKNRSELAWEAMYPDITFPVINSYFAGVPGYALFSGTSDSFGASSLVDSALSGGASIYAGYWVVVYSHSTNSWQYRQILSNDATTLTLVGAWTNGTPTGTGLFRIYAREVDCLKDIYFQMWMMTNMKAAHTNSTHFANLTKLIDQNGALANGTAFKQTSQDLGYLNEILAIGKTYLDYIIGGHTLANPA